jgi:glyoxylase-like metal-dependent hydrolase (beta-lactamase superfamily II)
MLIESMVVGEIQANCYIVGDGKTPEVAVIDPGGDGPDIIARIEKKKYNVKFIINTHGHVDHIWSNDQLKAAYPDAKLCIHELDAPMLASSESNLSSFLALRVTSPAPDKLLREGDTIRVGGLELKVIHIPGHSRGGICLLTESGDGKKIVFCGDTLFQSSIGRTDLPGGSHSQLISGIKKKLLTLPDDTRVYPGHGPPTTIGEEKLYNPFLV